MFTLDLIPLNLKLGWFTLTKYIKYMKMLIFLLITLLGRLSINTVWMQMPPPSQNSSSIKICVDDSWLPLRSLNLGPPLWILPLWLVGILTVCKISSGLDEQALSSWAWHWLRSNSNSSVFPGKYAWFSLTLTQPKRLPSFHPLYSFYPPDRPLDN